MLVSLVRTALMALSGWVRKYLSPFLTASPASISVPLEISDPAQRLNRFLLQSNWFSVAQNRVTARAFMPPPDRQLSTFLTSGVSESEIWSLGKTVLSEHPRPDASLYGRGDLTIAALTELKLKAFRDDMPHRHTCVVGWPDPTDKDREKILAQELARAAELVLLPRSIQKQSLLIN